MIKYCKNLGKLEDIISHLNICDTSFHTPLSTRTNITTYAEKLLNKSHCFEAWDQNKLIGLVAVYHDIENNKIAYISNVSIIPHYHQRGIAENLLKICIETLEKSGCHSIELKVEVNNFKAINLYMKLRFTKTSDNESYLTMQLNTKNFSQ